MAGESNGVFVEQTNKFAQEVGDGEYLTSDHRGAEPLFKDFLEESEYRAALNGIVQHCADVLIYDPGAEQFLIGTRDQEPHAGDWVIGGRMRAGETTNQAAAVNVKRELDITIDPERLKKVGDYKFVWDTRAQPSTPMADGTGRWITGVHDSTTLNLYPINADERTAIEHNDEYTRLHWLSADEILQAPRGQYHPALVQMINDSLEVLTRPEPPRTANEQRLRLTGQIATAKAALSRLELLQRLGNDLAALEQQT